MHRLIFILYIFLSFLHIHAAVEFIRILHILFRPYSYLEKCTIHHSILLGYTAPPYMIYINPIDRFIKLLRHHFEHFSMSFFSPPGYIHQLLFKPMAFG